MPSQTSLASAAACTSLIAKLLRRARRSPETNRRGRRGFRPGVANSSREPTRRPHLDLMGEGPPLAPAPLRFRIRRGRNSSLGPEALGARRHLLWS
jgi:hypothetical protein